MKRSFSFSHRSRASDSTRPALVAASTALIAATYGLVRFGYGLYLPDVQAALRFDAGVAGAVSAGASVLYCVGALVGFAASRRARALVVAAGASAGLGAAGMALAPTTAWFACAAIVASAGAGLASPAVVRVLQRNVRADAVDRAQSVANAGTGPGLVAAAVLALVLLPDWRSAWIVAVGVTVVVAALVVGLDRGDPDPGPAPRLLPPAQWFADHARVVVAALLLGAGSAAVWNSGRALLVERGATDTASLAAWACLGLGGSAVIVTTRWTSRLHTDITLAFTVAVLAVATAALTAVAASTVAACLTCLAFGWAYTAATGALITRTAEIDPERAATGTALLFVLLVLGQAVGALGLGLLVDSRGTTAAFLVAAAVAAVAVGAVLVRGRRLPSATSSGREARGGAAPGLPSGPGSLPTPERRGSGVRAETVEQQPHHRVG